uniref:Uncharacterized protein n=1 Tax=Rhizophora mucronata TaxID=61149 RepID=A0A2P2NI18_RHIMU
MGFNDSTESIKVENLTNVAGLCALFLNMTQKMMRTGTGCQSNSRNGTIKEEFFVKKLRSCVY